MRDRFLRKVPSGVVYLADKRPGNHWVPTWRLMVPDTLSPTRQIRYEREIRPGTNHKTYA
jgi:hypothetical protein